MSLYFFCLDSRISSFGVNVPRHVPPTSTMFDKLLNKGERMYILTKYRVQEEGYLAGLEFNVAQPGPIHVKVSTIKIH